MSFSVQPYPEDDFFAKLADQVTDDHRAVKARNRRKRAAWQQAPAMQLASNLIRGPFGLEPEGEAEYAQLLDQLAESLDQEPLVGRYMNHLNSTPVSARNNTEWWHALGHQYLAAMAWAQSRSRAEAEAEHAADMPTILDERLWSTKAFEGTGPREIAFEWAGRVLESKTYLWHQNTLEAAMAAPLVPHVVQPNALPFESVFFSFESAAFTAIDSSGTILARHGSDAEPTPVRTRTETWWIMVTALGDAGMMLTFDLQFWPAPTAEDPLDWVPQNHLIMEPIRWGARWPEDFQRSPFVEPIGAVLRMLAFMQAPFVDTTLLERKLPRPIRREYDRQQKQAPLKEVSIITLRKRLHEPVWSGGDDHEVRHDRFKYSWWVEGHYRWQWYPSEKTHRLIAIDSYMKQIGKPLLPQIRDVSR